MVEIQYSKAAIKNISKYDKRTKVRLKKGIEGLLKEPPEGDIKQLKGCDGVSYRLRIGKYRIIYGYEKGSVLHVKRIDSRGDIYK